MGHKPHGAAQIIWTNFDYIRPTVSHCHP